MAYSYPSDRRLKENVENYKLGLSFIKSLNPVSYNYIADSHKTRQIGFVAQDVEASASSLGEVFNGVKKSNDGIYSIAYTDFVMPLVNAINEQQKIIEDLKNKLLSSTSDLDNLKSRMNVLEQIVLPKNNH